MSKTALIDLTGKKFGSLSVIGRAPKTLSHGVRWNCICECGTSTVVFGQSLREGHTKSCGCLRKQPASNRTHGRSRTALYQIWRGIITRCNNPNIVQFDLYGGRGISVCDRWRYDFPNFLEDMGERPSPKHSVERVDPNGDYSPSNCRWATAIEQANNRRDTRYVEYRGKRMSICDAVRTAGSVIHSEAAWNRIARCAWTVERAVETPSMFSRSRGNKEASA